MENNLDASSVQALPPLWLHFSAQCLSHPSDAQCRMPRRPSTSAIQSQAIHETQTKEAKATQENVEAQQASISLYKLTSRQAYSPSLKPAAAQTISQQNYFGINWSQSSCRHPEKSWGLPLQGTKTGFMKTTERYRNGWRRIDQPTWPTWLSRPALRRKPPSATATATSSASSERYRRSGGLTVQKQLIIAWTLVTTKTSTML